MSPFAAAVVGLMLVVPGVAASLLLLRPDRIHLSTRLASVFGFGYAVVAVIATALTNLRVMKPAVFVVLLILVTVILWVALLRRGGLREHLRVLRRQLREDPWPLLVGAAVILVLAVVRWRFSPLVNFGHTEPWRYWADAQEVARAGRVPATAIHYGAPYPPTVSKIILNAFNAGVIFVIGSSPLPAMGALAWLVSIGSNLSAWALGRELGLRYTAPLLAVLTQFDARWIGQNVTYKVTYHYNAAYVGEMVALFAVALGVRVLRDFRWGDVVMVGALFGVAAGTHLLPTSVFLALLASYAIGRAVIRRDVAKPFAGVGVVVALTASIAVVAIGTSGGDVGFQGAGGADKYASFPPDFDPTLYLAKGVVHDPPILQPAARQRHLGGWYRRPPRILGDYVKNAVGFWVSRLWAYVLAVAGLLLAGLVSLRAPPELRPLGITALAFATTLFVVACGFSYVYTTKVPADFGVGRLDVWVIFGSVILVLALLEWGLWAFGRFRPSLLTPVACVAVAALALTFVPLSGPPADKTSLQRGSQETLDWIRTHVPRDARILASRRTAGTFEATVGRVSITEGMTPFLRPTMLKTVVNLLLEARSFFLYPVTKRYFLKRQDVGYVVFIKGNALGSEGHLLGDADEQKLKDAPFLRLVHQDPAADVYRVASHLG
jgi:hypothetical protein